ncbi:calcium-binding protein, partial [Mesorhizobium kowhaii]
GAAGNDVLDGGAGADRLVGGAGLDCASYASAAKSVVADLANAGANGGDAFGDIFSGIENISGSNFADTLRGDTHNNVLSGRAGNDSLDGAAGNDVLDGGAGADRLVGGAGLDCASYASAAKSVVADLANAEANGGDAFGDIFSGIENISGSNFADTLRGDTHNNVLSGRAGNDSLDGAAGNDVLDGGAGADRLVGGAGLDCASYASAAKSVVADLANAGANGGDAFGDIFSGIENISGSNFADTLRGDTHNNVLSGGAGNDSLDGAAGNDVLDGGAGADILMGGYGADRFQFQSTGDTIPGSRDTISDFVHGLDRIDLRLIDANTNVSGDQEFSFIGDHGFSGKAGEMHFVDHVLSGDVNGDSIADFSIYIRGTGPSYPDFFL